MKLPAESTITREKFTEYLLIFQVRSDKSRYLARAGYTMETVDQLIADLRNQILPRDATFVRHTAFGEIHIIDAPLLGPSGRQIWIRTIWLKHALSGAVHFVTLIPQPQSNA